MLFLVTMTHTAESCPVYHPKQMSATIESAKKSESIAKELGMKIHFMLSAIAGHTAYTLVEADNAGALSRYFGSIPFPQDYTVTPVGHLKDMIERAKEMLSEKK